MLAWGLLLLTLLTGALLGYRSYTEHQELEAAVAQSRKDHTELKRSCDKERATAAAQLDALKIENQQLVQEQAELKAGREEALREAHETGSALEKVKSTTARPTAKKRRRR